MSDTIKIDGLGVFEFDLGIHAYSGKCKFKDIEIDLVLYKDSKIKEVFDFVLKNYSKIEDKIIDETLDLKNEAWLSEGEEKFTREHFLKHLEFESIHMNPDNSFELFFGDGDMFGGHWINVRFSKDKKINSVDIAG